MPCLISNRKCLHNANLLVVFEGAVGGGPRLTDVTQSLVGLSAPSLVRGDVESVLERMLRGNTAMQLPMSRVVSRMGFFVVVAPHLVH